jgi:inorganic pyrophosphatase
MVKPPAKPDTGATDDGLATDLRGASRLVVEAVGGVTALVEDLHRTIQRVAPPIGRPRGGRTGGITGVVYGSVRGVTSVVGQTLDFSFARLAPLLDRKRLPEAPRAALLAALNGVLGDHLEASGNPLALPMQLRERGAALALDGRSAGALARPQRAPAGAGARPVHRPARRSQRRQRVTRWASRLECGLQTPGVCSLRRPRRARSGRLRPRRDQRRHRNPKDAEPVKYEVDKETGAIFVDRILSTPMRYPCNYGYVPHTLCGDGDPVDVLVILPLPLIPGSVIRCRPVGVLNMSRRGRRRREAAGGAGGQGVRRLQPHPRHRPGVPHWLERIGHFFEHYKDLEKGKWVKLDGWGSAAEARRIIEESIARFEAAPDKPKF